MNRVLELYIWFCLITIMVMLLSVLKIAILFKTTKRISWTRSIVEFFTIILKCIVPIYNIQRFIGYVLVLLATPNTLYDAANHGEKTVTWRHSNI